MTQRKGETKEEYLKRCREQQRNWYKKNKDKVLAYHKEYESKNREKVLEDKRNRYNKKRGDARGFCNESLELIENYELAKADNFVGWDLHHKLEIGAFYTLSVKELQGLDLYFNRPANELIYLRHGEHCGLHNRYR